MRISTNRSEPIALSSADGSTNATPASPTGETTPERPVTQAGGYTPSAELTQLTSLAQQQPDVRPDAVRSAAARLAQGYYATAASAEQTASAILNAID